MPPSSSHLVDPVLRPALDAFPPIDVSDASLPAIRAMLAERFPASPAAEEDVTVSTLHVPRPDGSGTIRVLAYRPTGDFAPRAAIVHMHGGGYVLGQPELNDADHRLLARECGVAIYSVDYRLAPETRFPGAIEDCYAVLRWLADHAREEGVDPARIGVKGESAGGGLAAALALLTRDRQGPLLAFQLLTFPALDDRTGSTTDPHPYCGEYLWTPDRNRYAWASLLGTEPGADGVSPYAAAARAESLSGLPATFIAVGALDLYLEEDLDYARRLTRAGVQVELHVYPGAVHGFGLAPGSWIDEVTRRDLQEGLMRILARFD